MNTNISPTKKLLLEEWLIAHTPNNKAPLFTTKAPTYKLNPLAIELLKSEKETEMYIYVVLLEDSKGNLTPIYIGKATNPWKRWNNGHLVKLRRAIGAIASSSYTRWVNLFENTNCEINLICIAESEIKFSPIPHFPTTVGSIEYQLISLTQDCFPEYLLNYEGVRR